MPERSRRFLLASITLTLVACTGPSLSQPPPPTDIGASMEIDARGGTIAVTDPSSPLFGATLHVPPGAVSTPTMFRIREAELPPQHGWILAGPAVEVLPAGVELAAEVTLTLPVHDGLGLDGVFGYFFEDLASGWQPVDSFGRGFRDPVEQLGAELVVRTSHFTVFAAVHEGPTLNLRSNVHATFEAELVASRALSAARFGFTFRSPEPGSLGTSASDDTGGDLRVLDGEYVFRVTGPGGSDERCQLVSILPAANAGSATSFVNATAPPCDLPTVSLEASSLVVMRGEEVELTGTVTDATGAVPFYWNTTGGRLSVREGTMSSGESTNATWTPTRVGTYDVYFTAYHDNGLFAEDRATITVRGNEPPEITSFLASPVRLAQGAPEGMREIAPMTPPDAESGLTRLTATATDPDGDPLSYYWWHALPGNYYEPTTGVMLGRDPDTGYATDPVTEAPFTGPEVLYMAPPASWLCGGALPLGMWLGLHVNVSDGQSVDRSWVMVGMECLEEDPEPPGGSDGHHCYEPGSTPDPGLYDSTGRCYFIPGSKPDWLDVECFGSVDSGPCPSAPDTAACTDSTPSEGSIVTNVLYGLPPAGIAEYRASCLGREDVFTSPWMF